MNAIDWSKAPPHATHWCPGNAKIEAGWIYNPGGTKGEFYSCYADRGLEHIPAFPDWRKSRLVQRPPKQPWAGEGLPPVGMACEAAIPHTSGPDNERSHIWIEGRVIAYHEIKGKTYAWFSEDDGFYPPSVLEFRPIRTPEQIAAEERLHEILNACTDINYKVEEFNANLDCSLAIRATIEAMIDAGYRKQVMP
jgi:hypothetical protein